MLIFRGQEQVNEGTVKEDFAAIVKDYDTYLKHRYWSHCSGGPLSDWCFVYNVKEFGTKVIKTHGNEGFHFAYGWAGLQDMIDKYGRDHAPKPNKAMKEAAKKKKNQDVPMASTTTTDVPTATTRAARVSLSPTVAENNTAAKNEDTDDDDQTILFGAPSSDSDDFDDASANFDTAPVDIDDTSNDIDNAAAAVKTEEPIVIENLSNKNHKLLIDYQNQKFVLVQQLATLRKRRRDEDNKTENDIADVKIPSRW